MPWMKAGLLRRRRRLVSAWNNPTEIVRGSHEPYLENLKAPDSIDKADIAARMMFLDLVTCPMTF